MLEVVPFRVSIGTLRVPSLSFRIGLTAIVVVSTVICVPSAVSRGVAICYLSSLMIRRRPMMSIVRSRLAPTAMLRILSITIDIVVIIDTVVVVVAPLSSTRRLLEVG